MQLYPFKSLNSLIHKNPFKLILYLAEIYLIYLAPSFMKPPVDLQLPCIFSDRYSQTTWQISLKTG